MREFEEGTYAEILEEHLFYFDFQQYRTILVPAGQIVRVEGDAMHNGNAFIFEFRGLSLQLDKRMANPIVDRIPEIPALPQFNPQPQKHRWILEGF